MSHRRRALTGVLLLAMALAAQWQARGHPDLVERVYARRLYPAVGRMLGRGSSLVPFSFAEAFLLIAGTLVVALLAVGVSKARTSRPALLALAGRTLANGLLVAGLAFLSFLLVWGFNYARQPFATNANLPVAKAPPSELAELAKELLAEASREREGQPEDSRGALRIEGSLDSIARRVERGYEAITPAHPWLAGGPSRPKPVFFSGILSRLGISGIFFPHTGEPNVNVTLPDAELPFSASHEVAHERGVAREDEANYVAYLACTNHPDPDFRYSGFLNASQYVLAELYRADPAAYARVERGRSAAMRRDDLALREWILKYRGRATEVGRKVNDAYLKSLGQADGVRSYGRMIDLLLAERRQRGSAPAAAP